jgi:hypothetical protein
MARLETGFSSEPVRKVSENATSEREREQSDPDQNFLSSFEKLGHRAWSSGSLETLVYFRVVPSRDQNSLDECKRWPSDSRYP